MKLALRVAVFVSAALIASPIPAAAAVAPAANTAKNADLKIWSDPAEHTYVSTTQTFGVVVHFQDLGPDNTYSGDVTWEWTAPGGTHFIYSPDPTDPACHVFVPHKHFTCVQVTEQMVISGADLESAGLFVDSVHTTPGRVTETCACDHNTSNNSAALIVHVDGATTTPTHTSKPKPTATHSTPPAQPATPAATQSTAAPSPSVPASSGSVFSEPASPDATDAALGTPAHRSPGPLVFMIAMIGAGLVALGYGAWQWRRRGDQA